MITVSGWCGGKLKEKCIARILAVLLLLRPLLRRVLGVTAAVCVGRGVVIDC